MSSPAASQWSEPLRDMPFREGQVIDPSASMRNSSPTRAARVDAWETTYIHDLSGEHPVLEWITGTALRPVKSRLSEAQWQQFRQELIPMLDAAYPARADGKTFFPFRRIFVVAQVGLTALR